MFIALSILTILTALLAINSAVEKLRKNEQVLTSIVGTVRFPERFVPLLAAAAGLVLYFAGAVIAHLRVRDMKGITMPLIPLALSVAVFMLRLLTI